jgi:hypothetical protein
MTQEVLGKISFLDTPDVGGQPVVLNDGTVPSFSAAVIGSRPVAGLTGRIFIDTTTLDIQRDNGSSWDTLSALIVLSDVANQISITQATSSTPAIIGLANDIVIPGTSGFTPPTGTTAQRPVSPLTGQTRVNSTLGYTELYNGAVWQPQGRVLQVVTGNIPASSGTTTVPLDNTVPTSTEGNLIWTQSFTPISAASRIIITFIISTTSSATTAVNILSVFAGTANIGSVMTRPVAINIPTTLSMHIVYVPGSTAAITFTARLGGSIASTAYCNQTNTATLGGAAATEYTITEVL